MVDEIDAHSAVVVDLVEGAYGTICVRYSKCFCGGWHDL